MIFSLTKIPEGVLGQVITPQKQAEIVRSFLTEIKDGLLAVVSGNHDDRFYNATGFDIYSYLISNLKIPLLNSGGVLGIKVG